MPEKWKIIPGFYERYEVSTIGRARTVPYWSYNGKVMVLRKQRYLKPSKSNGGYLQYGLTKDKKQVKYMAHRLVMLAFVGESDLQVNHLNGKKDDNRLINLEYCTRSENLKHAYANGFLLAREGEDHPLSKMTEKKVLEIREKYIPRKYSSRKLAKEYGISKTNVLDIVNRKIWDYDHL